jgi:hypothetical protein
MCCQFDNDVSVFADRFWQSDRSVAVAREPIAADDA